MNTTGAGLRVLNKRNPYFSEDPQIVIFKLDTTDMRFIEVHGSPEALVGYPNEQWTESGFWPGRLHPDDREAAAEFCANCSQLRQEHELEFRVIRADGAVIWVHEIVKFEEADPDSPIATGYIMNITNRVAHEEDVREVLGLKDELFRVLLEDISLPVNKISNFGEMLERHLATQGDDVGSDFAVGLREGLQELDGLVQRLQKAGRNADTSFEELSRTLAALRSDRSGWS
ncbi:MAG: PAS domain-containing protein [Pseudomonadota bacterium]